MVYLLPEIKAQIGATMNLTVWYVLQLNLFHEAQLDLGHCCWNSYTWVPFRAIRICHAASAVAPIKSQFGLASKP
jgi:hypothetical protein